MTFFALPLKLRSRSILVSAFLFIILSVGTSAGPVQQDKEKPPPGNADKEKGPFWKVPKDAKEFTDFIKGQTVVDLKEITGRPEKGTWNIELPEASEAGTAIQFSDELMILLPEELDDGTSVKTIKFSTDVKSTPKKPKKDKSTVDVSSATSTANRSTPIQSEEVATTTRVINSSSLNAETNSGTSPSTLDIAAVKDENQQVGNSQVVEVTAQVTANREPDPADGGSATPPADDEAIVIGDPDEPVEDSGKEIVGERPPAGSRPDGASLLENPNKPAHAVNLKDIIEPKEEKEPQELKPVTPEAVLKVKSGFFGEKRSPLTPRTLEASLAIESVSDPIAQAEIALDHNYDTSTFEPIPESMKMTSPNNLESPVLFEVEVFNPGNKQIKTFKKPALMVVDLRSYELDLDERGGKYFLTFENPDKPGEWIEVPITVHQRSGLISAEVDHFSNWSSGWRPEAWGMSWTPPTTAEFTGAASYSYPFNIPPGRGGFQPVVGLSYNSNGQNGAIPGWKADSAKPESPVADGWSLQQSGVFRQSGKYFIDSGDLTARQMEAFTLVVAGTGYEIYPETGDKDLNEETGDIRYFAKDHPEIRITRNGFNSTITSTWKVELPSGAMYTMGGTEDTNQRECFENMAQHIIYPYRSGWPQNGIDEHISGAGKCLPIGWHAREAVDKNGNKIQWSYASDNTALIKDEHNNDKVVQEIMRIETILYNFEPGTTNNPASKIEFLPLGIDRIDQVKIYHGINGSGNLSVSRMYDIVTDEVQWESDGCLDHDYTPAEKLKHPVAKLSSITEKVGDWNNSNSYIELPATTFTYHQLEHFTKNTLGCFYFPYLETYTNGYGGSVTFTYGTDGISHGDYVRLGTSNYQMPTRGYSWFVDQVETNPGIGERVKTDYDYKDICYDQGWPGVCDSNTSSASSSATGNPGNQPLWVGGIGGHAVVTATTVAIDLSNLEIARTITNYHSDGDLMGKPITVTTGYPATSGLGLDNAYPQNETIYNYDDEGYGPTEFNYTSEEISRSIHPGNEIMTNRKIYTYDPAYQKHTDKSTTNTTQFGQLTHIEEYVDGSANPIRVTQNYYVYDSGPDDWIIRPLVSSVYTGTVGSTLGTFVSGERYFYDADPNDPINTNRHWDNQDYRLIEGNMTRKEIFFPSTRTCAELTPAISCSGVDVWYDTINTGPVHSTCHAGGKIHSGTKSPSTESRFKHKKNEY